MSNKYLVKYYMETHYLVLSKISHNTTQKQKKVKMETDLFPGWFISCMYVCQIPRAFLVPTFSLEHSVSSALLHTKKTGTAIF